MEVQAYVDGVLQSRWRPRQELQQPQCLLEQRAPFLKCGASPSAGARAVQIRDGLLPDFALTEVRRQRGQMRVEVVGSQGLQGFADAAVQEAPAVARARR
jgi:hypothetical protein